MTGQRLPSSPDFASLASPDDRLRLVLASVKDYAIFLLDPSGRIATWNAGARLIKGYLPEEVIGKDFSMFYTPDDVAAGRPRALLQKALEEGRVEDEGWRVRKDGTRFWADVVITRIVDPHGRVEGYLKVTRDLTARRNAEDALRRSEESLAATLYSIGDGVLAADDRGRVTRMNRVAEQLTGWSEAEAIGRPLEEVFDIINEVTRNRAPNPVERVLKEGVIVGLADHTALIARDGTERPIADSGAPIRDRDGITRGAVLVFRDVSSERRADQQVRQAQEAMRRSEASLRATLYSIGDGVLATDQNARITRMNPVAERLTGWAEQEALGLPVESVFPIVNERTRAPVQNPVTRALREGVIVGLANHSALVGRDGTERPIADSGAPIIDKEGNRHGAVLVFRDVTAERTADEAIRQSEERLRLMIASVRDYALYMLDAAGHVVSWNPGAERIKGYGEQEIVGQHFSRFFTAQDVADGKPQRELERALTEGRFEEEGWRVRKDGTRFWASVIVTPIHDAANRHVGFVKVTRDLTEPKKAEEERVRLAEAREAVRLRDEFLSIASHELKTPLTALQLQLERIRTRVRSIGDDTSEAVARAIQGGNRLAQLIEALLDVSRIATARLEMTFERCDLADAVRETVERLRELASAAGCELRLNINEALEGSWDRLRIQQVLTNLLANAIKFGARAPIEVTAAREGQAVVLQVRDQGPGIPQSELSRVFERFERAAPSRHYGGLGLGLYVARQITEAHGGTIVATNPPGGGACLTVRIPVLVRQGE